MNLSCVPAVRRRVAATVGIAGLAATVLVAVSSPAEAARRRHRPTAGGGYSPPYAAMVVDVKTGRTLHAENEDAPRYPASVTKVMTLYLVFEQLERGKIELDTPLEVSANAAAQAPSKLGLRPGSAIAVEDAIKALVTKSANDVAVTVAENLGGSVEGFTDQMTRKARALGMSRTVYRNPSGLPDPEQVTTARDLTILARAIQERFPTYYRYFQTRSFRYAGRSHGNHNKLLGRVEGVDGIKTGFTRASGFNLMTNARTDDRHIVAVVLGGRSGGHRDGIVTALVQSNLPRAFAGARSTPVVAEAERPRPTLVADAARPKAVAVDPDATAATPAPSPGRPLDLAAMRPVVASAAGGSATTPTSPLRWLIGPAPAQPPAAAQAYAPVQTASAAPMTIASLAAAPSVLPTGKIEARLPAPSAAAIIVRREAKDEDEASAPRKETVARSLSAPPGWVIQLAAMDDEGKARELLEEARSKSGRALGKAAPFTEKVSREGGTLFRARFSGFADDEAAQDACKALKRSGFACFATRS
jgi:D-alanyl-D-alanine carboxypeptidase